MRPVRMRSGEGLPGSCSVQWEDEGLPAWGTAAPAGFLVGLQQDGPWGHQALIQSRLDPDLGAALARAGDEHGGHVLLIRRVGPPTTDDEPGRHVIVSGGWASKPWVVAGMLDDPARLLDLPWTTLAGPQPPDWPELEPAPATLLVCTNAKRDACCAVRGRPLAAMCSAENPGQVWESSHLKGHKFAPTALVLPTGQVLGRLTTELGSMALAAATQDRYVAPGPRHDRGRSALDPVAQAADAAVRSLTGENGVGDLGVIGGDDGTVVLHADGRLWTVDVTARTRGVRPESCGDRVLPSLVWDAVVRPSLTLNEGPSNRS